MKSFLAITIIMGCMAFLEAGVLKQSSGEKQAALGNPFFAGGTSNDGDGMGSPIIGTGGNGAAAAGGNANDGGGDTPNGAGPGTYGGYGGYDGYAGRSGTSGGYGGGRDGYRGTGRFDGYGTNPGGGTYGTGGYGRTYGTGGYGAGGDGSYRPRVEQRPARPYGAGDSVSSPNTEEKAKNPGQIVGSAGSTGTTVGIVVGVVALVGVAAGVAIFVIKRRN
ncbi:uncharacterized protein [Asterias amurensis]|uniref:uncharacterized protein n=1 Tax=Asterias amurensis TaxID=7602 RepID=UPI003AB126A1